MLTSAAISPNTRASVEGTRAAEAWIAANGRLLPDLRRRIIEYHATASRDFPWRHTRDPYRVLIAEILLQKTSVRPVASVWTDLIDRYPDIMALSRASLADLEALISPLGLTKRAEVLHEVAQRIAAYAGGEIPANADLLGRLPGVGDYTTSAVMSFAFGIRADTIDVNAARVYSRVAGFAPKTKRQGLAFARVVGEKVITETTHREVNLGMLDLSAQVCRINPLCATCPLASLCYHASNRPIRART